jgi:hypothetical protein
MSPLHVASRLPQEATTDLEKRLHGFGRDIQKHHGMQWSGQSLVWTRIILPPRLSNLAHHGCMRFAALSTKGCNWAPKDLRRPKGNPKYLHGHSTTSHCRMSRAGEINLLWRTPNGMNRALHLVGAHPGFLAKILDNVVARSTCSGEHRARSTPVNTECSGHNDICHSLPLVCIAHVSCNAFSG